MQHDLVSVSAHNLSWTKILYFTQKALLQAKRWRAHHPVELPHRSTSQSNLPPNILGFHPTNLPSSPPTDLQSLQLAYQHVSHLSYPTNQRNYYTSSLPTYYPTDLQSLQLTYQHVNHLSHQLPTYGPTNLPTHSPIESFAPSCPTTNLLMCRPV